MKRAREYTFKCFVVSHKIYKFILVREWLLCKTVKSHGNSINFMFLLSILHFQFIFSFLFQFQEFYNLIKDKILSCESDQYLIVLQDDYGFGLSSGNSVHFDKTLPIRLSN